MTDFFSLCYLSSVFFEFVIRLIMYMERDKKKQHQVEKPEQQSQVQYLNICLNSLLTEITRRVPIILSKHSSYTVVLYSIMY